MNIYVIISEKVIAKILHPSSGSSYFIHRQPFQPYMPDKFLYCQVGEGFVVCDKVACGSPLLVSRMF